MRVTANTFSSSLVDSLGSLAVRQQRLQSQAATGQRIRLPEDDPVALRRVIDLQTEFSAVGQYSRNIARETEKARAASATSNHSRPFRIEPVKSPPWRTV